MADYAAEHQEQDTGRHEGSPGAGTSQAMATAQRHLPSRPCGLGPASRELYTSLKQWGSVVAWRAACVAGERGRRIRIRAAGHCTAKRVLRVEQLEQRWPSPRELAADWRRIARMDGTFPPGIIPVGEPCHERLSVPLLRPAKAFIGRPDTSVALGYLTVCRLFREVGEVSGTPLGIQRSLCWLMAVPRYAGIETSLKDLSNAEALEVRVEAWCREASRELRVKGAVRQPD